MIVEHIEANATQAMREYTNEEGRPGLPTNIYSAMSDGFTELEKPNFNAERANSFVLNTCWVEDFLTVANTPFLRPCGREGQGPIAFLPAGAFGLSKSHAGSLPS